MAFNGNVAGKLLRGRINSIDTLILSAYAIAVKHGFKGTEEEWLASLNGGGNGASGAVKTVNGVPPDKKGNVEIEIATVSDVLDALPTWTGGSY